MHACVHLCYKLVVQVCIENPTVVSITHSSTSSQAKKMKSTVMHLADKISERVPGFVFIAVFNLFSEVVFEERKTDAEVALVEIVRHVPAQLAEFAALLHDGMEEGINRNM